MDFIKQYIDRDKLFNRALNKKIQMFYDPCLGICQWINKILSKDSSKQTWSYNE